MKYVVAPDVILSDHTHGFFESNSKGQRVAATPLIREIVSSVCASSTLSQASSGSTSETNRAVRELVAAGILLTDDVGAKRAAPILDRAALTMFNAPERVLEDVGAGEIVFIGAPLDAGCTHVPGARFGPSALRAASVERFSCQFSLETGEMLPWSLHAQGGPSLDGAKLSDLGDVGYMPGEPIQCYYDRLQLVVQSVLSSGAFPIVLGGDHSITWSTQPPDPVHLVHLDAHSDLAKLEPGHCHHHGNVLTRLLDEGSVTHITTLGLRDDSQHEPDNPRLTRVTMDMIDTDLSWIAPLAGEPVFITFDVDVLDPSVAPGTGTPVAGGLSHSQICQLLDRIARVTRPIGLDIVELCPLRDESGNSERAVVDALLWFLVSYVRTHGQTQFMS